MAYGLTHSASTGASNTNEYLSYETDNYGISSTSAQTWGGWVKILTAPATNTGVTLFEKGDVGHPNMRIDYQNISGTLQLVLVRNSNATNNTQTYNIDLGTTGWHYLAMSYSGTVMSLFVDSTFVVTLTSSFDQTNSDQGFGIGARVGGGGSYSSAEYNNVTVWNTNLSAASISAIVCSYLTSGTNLVASYSLDNTVNDGTSGGRNLTNHNSVTFVTDVPSVCAPSSNSGFFMLM